MPRRPTEAARVAQILREEILAELEEGRDRLPSEVRLSERLGVGRSTIREALSMLAAEGLIVSRRGGAGGIYLQLPDTEFAQARILDHLTLAARGVEFGVDDLLESRTLFEVPLAGVAALRRTDEDLENLQRALIDPESDEMEVPWAANLDFHTQIALATHNPILYMLANPLNTTVQRRFARDSIPIDVWKRVHQEHEMIAQAVADRNKALAEALMLVHLSNLSAVYREIDERQKSPGDG